MTPEAGTPAGATATTETVSPTRVAAETGDVGGFLQAERDARLGKPHEAVTREKPAGSEPAAKEKPVSKWAKPAEAPAETPAERAAKGPSQADRDADDRLRRITGEAVETATAELKRQNRELAERLAKLAPADKADAEKKAEAKAVPVGRLTKAEIAKYQSLPDAPKLDDKDANGEYLYDTPGEHNLALGEFIREKRGEETAARSARSASLVQRGEQEAARHKSFGERVEKFKAENADLLVDRVVRGADGTERTVKAVPLSDEVQRLHGWAMLAHINAERGQRGEAPIPASVDHAIAEQLYDAEEPAVVAVYLSQNPDELKFLRSAASEGDLAVRFGRIAERAASKFGKPADKANGGGEGADKTKTAGAARQAAEKAVDRSVSSVTPPATVLGKGHASVDPIEQAVKSGDVGLFLELEKQARIEKAGYPRRR